MLICGDGVAAYCCAHLRGKAGFQVDLQAVGRARLPVILLGDQALALMRDIFDQPALFGDAARIRKRVVSWGTGPHAVEHSAVLISEEILLEAMRPRRQAGHWDVPWTIHAAPPLPAPTIEQRFGTRNASAVPVMPRADADPETCWIESLEGWLLAVSAPAETLLGQSQLTAEQIAGRGAVRTTFPAFARIASPLAGEGWPASGTAAMAFDPICGDGTAQAIREAILASAVVRDR